MNLLRAVVEKTSISLEEDDLESIFSIDDEPSEKTIGVIEMLSETSDEEYDESAEPNEQKDGF